MNETPGASSWLARLLDRTRPKLHAAMSAMIALAASAIIG